MHIVVAPDSFKGSLTSVEASAVMKRAILDIAPESTVEMKPMADGGEGTLDAILQASEGTRISVSCTDALGDRITADYGIIDEHTAVIECAAIAGLPQVPVDKRNPDVTTTYGIGEVIVEALNKGCTSLIIALGGSATNDGGLGMLMALGLDACDEADKSVEGFGADVANVVRVDAAHIDPRLAKTEIRIASDVDNPLCGERGATAVFGPQKGATPEQVVQYDDALERFGAIIEKTTDRNITDIPGAGAAGGLGFALLSLGGSMVSGAELVAETMEMERTIEAADVVLTGEGQSDEQTLYGKAPGYVASIANKHQTPVVLISGSLSGNLDALRERFSGCFSIINQPLTLEECLEKADVFLYEETKQVMHLICSL